MNIDQIDRDRVEVIIFTPQYRIEGKIHILPGGRITDFVNADSTYFIAVTQAKIYSSTPREEEPLYEKDFLALNKEYVIVMIPKEED